MAALRRCLPSHVARSLFSTLTSSAPDKPTFSSYRKLRSAIKSETDPEKLAEIFQKSSNLSIFNRDRPMFDLSIEKLAASGRQDLIEWVLEHQKSLTQSPFLKSEGFWIRIMMLYSSAGMVDQAVRTFDQMKEMGCNRTEKSLCAILSVFLENRKFDKVHESFAEIPPKIGVSPSAVSYSLVLKAFCKEKSLQSLDSARSLLEQMEKEKGLSPDITSYNILLGAYLKRKDATKFDETVKEISDKGLQPNLTTYNHRISRFCRAKECVRAKKLFDEMVSKGIKPNSTSYNTLIHGFCKVGDFESAKKVLERMCSDNVAPTSITYVTMIRYMVEEGEFESALEMCNECMKRKWAPPLESMEGLINGLVKSSKVDEAKEIAEKVKMKVKGSAVDSWKKIESGLPL
ncbi:PREDICTED: pentatricopeptide repeat-containing protein At1g61870, mitochondrial-like [Nelumbo nucifera]|uniref:Pentatricopeptide repeat-containing protein At1g61870, mitochondrial n=2 Tax=Nelumbo nucifera TaxID=4432 RepID=A0A822YEM5_NELNU|nr:PREDICTED: pentatricopeptide repeat-containing protein At1g61870, mitochondrial-like [Nelumbo nucifera]DAD32624.1 TPA_asm: hypothetical protein HUJ06_011475 [Nelumbo nucifera]